MVGAGKKYYDSDGFDSPLVHAHFLNIFPFLFSFFPLFVYLFFSVVIYLEVRLYQTRN
jgi:hypothetical protein